MIDTQKIVERSIYEKMRLALVALGYLPDITNVAFAYTNAQGKINWNNALAQIQKTRGFAVELFGTSNSQAKGLKAVPRIVLKSRRTLPGDVGIAFTPMNVDDPLNPGSYVKVQFPYETSDFMMDIHLVTNSTEQHRLVHYALGQALGQRAYVPEVNDQGQKTGEHFFIERVTYYEIPDTIEGIDENVYTYNVKDLMIFEGQVLGSVPAIQEIKVETHSIGGKLSEFNVDGDTVIP